MTCYLTFPQYEKRQAEFIAAKVTELTGDKFEETHCNLCGQWHVNRVFKVEIGEYA